MELVRRECMPPIPDLSHGGLPRDKKGAGKTKCHPFLVDARARFEKKVSEFVRKIHPLTISWYIFLQRRLTTCRCRSIRARRKATTARPEGTKQRETSRRTTPSSNPSIPGPSSRPCGESFR